MCSNVVISAHNHSELTKDDNREDVYVKGDHLLFDGTILTMC